MLHYANPFNLKPEIIFVLGGPGSGKGTHCARLAKQKGYIHISTGELIRQLVAGSNETPEIKVIRQKILLGELLDDQQMLTILKEEMARHPNVPGFLIDGYPRTLTQLDLFEKQMRACDRVLYFDVDDELMKKRIIKRGLEESRLDDNSETAMRRIQTYKEKSLPVIQYLQTQKNLLFHTIDSRGPKEAVYDVVDCAMRSRQKNHPLLTLINRQSLRGSAPSSAPSSRVDNEVNPPIPFFCR